MDIGLSLLGYSGVPFQYWHFAFDTAVYLINRMPSQALSKAIPYQLLYKQPPDYKFLRVFGYAVYPLLHPYNRHKFSFRTTQCIFLGYSAHYLGYRCLDKATGRIYMARHVRFDELLFPFQTGSVSTPMTQPSTSATMPWLQLILPTSQFCRQYGRPQFIVTVFVSVDVP